MKYSIVVPVYNSEDTINYTLEKLLNHQNEDYEIIVVDDGSTDDTLDVLKTVEKNTDKIKVIPQKNTGPAGARNRGIAHATGEYVLFVDADDSLNLEIFNYLEYQEDDFDLLIFSYYISNQTKLNRKVNQYGHPKKPFAAKDLVHLYLDGLINTLWNKVYKKSILDEYSINFEESLRMGEDLIFNLHYLVHSKNIIYDDEAYYTYSIGDSDSVSNELPDNYYEIQLYLFESVLYFFEEIRPIAETGSIDKLYASFMKSVSNYMKRAAASHTMKDFNELMSKTISKERSLRILKRIYTKDLTRSHKLIYFMIIREKYRIAYLLYKILK